MSKKFLISIFLIMTVLCASLVYATENTDIMLINEENNAGAPIPEEWRRTGITDGTKNMTVIDKSYVMGEENSSLADATINGNLFALGTNVSLNNVVIHGDVFIMGQNITLSNITVNGTGFILGEISNLNTVNFTGNIFNLAQTINFTGTAQDVFALAGDMSFNEGTIIGRDIFGAATKIVFDANAGKDVNIRAEEISIMPNTNIIGTLNYLSHQEAVIDSDSSIGVVNFNKIQTVSEEDTESTVVNSKINNVVLLIIKSIFISGFIFLFARGFIEKQKVSNVVSHIGINTLKGLGWFIIIPIIAILLLFTGITFGISIVLFILYGVVLWASVAIVSVTIATNLKTQKESNMCRLFGTTFSVTIIISILKQLPITGVIVTFVTGIAALGIVMSSLKNKKIKKVDTVIETECKVEE